MFRAKSRNEDRKTDNHIHRRAMSEFYLGGEWEWDNQLRLNSCMARNSLPRKTYLARKRNLAWLGKKRKVGKTEKKGKNF